MLFERDAEKQAYVYTVFQMERQSSSIVNARFIQNLGSVHAHDCKMQVYTVLYDIVVRKKC